MKISSIGVLSSSKPISYKSNIKKFPERKTSPYVDNSALFPKGNVATMYRPQIDTLKSSLTIFQRASQKAKEAEKFYSQALWDLAYGIENQMQTMSSEEGTKNSTTFDKFGNVYLIRRYNDEGIEKDFIQISDACTYILTKNDDNEYDEYVFKNGNLLSLATNVVVDRISDKQFDEKFTYHEDGSLKNYETN